MNDTINMLDSVNWNFNFRNEYRSGKIHPINCRKYFSYPATFIPEIPYALIEILSKSGDVVLDPFGGIGTTFFQAIVQMRQSISFDINYVASEINKSLFRLINPEIELANYKQRIMDFCNDYDDTKKYSLQLKGLRKELKDWYAPNTYNQVSYLILKFDEIEEKMGPIEFALFEICLADILTTVSSQNRGWAYIADNVKPKRDDLREKPAIERFGFCLKRIVDDFTSYKIILGEEFEKFYKKQASHKSVYNIDFVNVDITSNDLVDLVVTSPPYPKMIDYVKSQRLVYYLFDRAYDENFDKEIGARYYRNKKDSLDKYLESMKKCNDKLFRYLKEGGLLCYILPDYSDETRNKERKEIIEEVVQDCLSRGFQEKHIIERYIPGTKRANNMKWASLKNEKIYIFEKVMK